MNRDMTVINRSIAIWLCEPGKNILGEPVPPQWHDDKTERKAERLAVTAHDAVEQAAAHRAFRLAASAITEKSDKRAGG